MNSFLALALKQAARSQCKYRVGAVLAKGSRVLGQAANRQRNSPCVDFRNATFHAEEALLRRVSAPHGAVIYVARIDSQGLPALARPCARCQRVLSLHGITLAQYTTITGPGRLWLPPHRHGRARAQAGGHMWPLTTAPRRPAHSSGPRATTDTDPCSPEQVKPASLLSLHRAPRSPALGRGSGRAGRGGVPTGRRPESRHGACGTQDA